MAGASTVAEAKAAGGEALTAGDFARAVDAYTRAIELAEREPAAAEEEEAAASPNAGALHILYSNRSAANASKGELKAALADATKCTELDPKFVKGYSRRGYALQMMGRFTESIAVYREGMIHATNDSAATTKLQECIAQVEARRESWLRHAQGGGAGVGATGAAGVPGWLAALMAPLRMMLFLYAAMCARH
jgi:tetratricopeptide (TPR) repeat protein|eukprot:SAG25_NODE_36_length_19907_cov_10.787027_13_plen_192_part_00